MPGLRGAAAARQHRHALLPRDLNERGEVLLAAWDRDGARKNLIDRGIRGVAPARRRIDEDLGGGFAADAIGQFTEVEKPAKFDKGVVIAFRRIRRIRVLTKPSLTINDGAGLSVWQEVLYDCDAELEHVTANGVDGLVPLRDQSGYVQLQPTGDFSAPTEARIAALFAAVNGPIGGSLSTSARVRDADYAHELIYAVRTRAGSPGVNLLTPIRLANTDTVVLVNRGWVYLPDGGTIDLGKWHDRD